MSHIDDIVLSSISAGAVLEYGGKAGERFYRPTVLSNVVPGMRAFDEEIFGPVAAVTPFDSDKEAIELANRTEFGLSCGVIGEDLSRATSLGNQLRCGMLHINEQTVMDGASILSEAVAIPAMGTAWAASRIMTNTPGGNG